MLKNFNNWINSFTHSDKPATDIQKKVDNAVQGGLPELVANLKIDYPWIFNKPLPDGFIRTFSVSSDQVVSHPDYKDDNAAHPVLKDHNVSVLFSEQDNAYLVQVPIDAKASQEKILNELVKHIPNKNLLLSHNLSIRVDDNPLADPVEVKQILFESSVERAFLRTVLDTVVSFAPNPTIKE